MRQGVIVCKAAEVKQDPEEFLKDLIERVGSIRRAALELGVADNTIKDFMSRRGLKLSRRQVATLEKKTS